MIVKSMDLQCATDGPDYDGSHENDAHLASRQEVNLSMWEGHLASGHQHP